MLNTSIRATTLLLAAGLLWGAASTAHAQCATCATPTFAYQPVTAYQPVAYPTVRTGWYPGYLLDRIRGAFRRPAVTAAYPATYTAAYPATYAVNYAPVQTVARPVALTAYQAVSAPACTTCCSAPCCCPQQVTLRPVTTCCDPCPTCSCDPCCCGTASTVSAVYDANPGCATCASAATYTVPSTTQSVPANTTPDTFRSEPQPTIAPDENPSAQRIDTSPSDTGSFNRDYNPGSATRPSSSLFEAPKLFDPRDSVTERSRAPVWTAVYQRPVQARTASHSLDARAQAERDALSWASAN